MDCTGLQRRSILEDLLSYWKDTLPPAFKADLPTLLSVAYYPLKLVVAEWVSYVEVMAHSIKQYEYSIEASAEIDVLAKLGTDLRSLQVWGRRSMETIYKLRSVARFLQSCNVPSLGIPEYALIVEDYEHISEMVELYSHRMESMVPVVTSLVQIADTRRSLKEAENVTRLTNLALLFIPLSFVSGLFSMNNDISAHSLKVYCSVAIPLCVFVFSMARLLPFINMDRIWRIILRTKTVVKREMSLPF